MIDCKMADDKSAISFDFSMPFEIHDDSEILKRLNMNQYISAVTSAPGLGSHRPHLHRDWARRCLPHLHCDWARRAANRIDGKMRAEGP